MRESGRRRIVGALAALLLVAGSILVSLGVVVARSLSSADGATAAWEILRDRDLVLDPLMFAATQAAIATVAGLLAGSAASYFLSRRGIPFRSLLTAALLIPVAMPPVVAALGMRELAGGEIEPAAMIVGTHALFALGVTVWLVTPAWTVVEGRTIEAARALGASRASAFRTLAWPNVRRQIQAAAGLAFLGAFAAVGTVEVLGGATERTFESTIANVALDGSITRAELAVLVLAQFGFSVVIGVIGRAMWRWPVSRGAATQAPSSMLLRIVGLLVLLPLVVAALAPLGAVIRAALIEGGLLDTTAFANLLDGSVGGHRVQDVIVWTLIYGGAAAVVATLLAGGAAGLRRRRRRTLFTTSTTIMLGIGFVLTPAVLAVTLLEGAQQLWRDVDRAAGYVFLAHTLLAFPIAWRVIESPSGKSRRHLRETAQLLGHRPRTASTRWGEKRLAPAFAAALQFAFVISLGEVAMTWLLTPGDATTVSVAILDATRDTTSADRTTFALATVLAIPAILSFLFAERFRRISARVEAP